MPHKKDFEITFSKDGNMIVMRSSKECNDSLLSLFDDMNIDTSGLKSFFSVTDDSEIIFNEYGYCG